MRRVQQRHRTEVDEDGLCVPGGEPGDCFQACMASIFELPLELAPGRGGNTQGVREWLALNYSGIGLSVREWDEPRTWVYNTGFWIATVVSPRFRRPGCDRCVTDRRRKSDPGVVWRRDECPHCNGTGNHRGLHAIVMEHARRAWDPHPDVDWDAEPQIVGETVFVVEDPTKLSARVVPQLVPERVAA